MDSIDTPDQIVQQLATLDFNVGMCLTVIMLYFSYLRTC